MNIESEDNGMLVLETEQATQFTYYFTRYGGQDNSIELAINKQAIAEQIERTGKRPIITITREKLDMELRHYAGFAAELRRWYAKHRNQTDYRLRIQRT